MEGDPPFYELHLPAVQLHVLPPHEMDDFEMLVNLPAGFRARIGLNETGLTRALATGDFSVAEKIIEETTDVEYLNDGALAATPLNMVLTGRSSFFHQSRNLKLALALMTKGANPNLRIPNHDMETASESPLELLLRYYLKLTEVFGLPGSGFCRTSYRPSSFEETELMDTIGLHGELGGLGPGQITGQARQLLLFCLEHGGDPNLPTTDAAKTIYHLALIAPRPDQPLLARMLELGGNVNMADVHNTTPLMDVISLGDEARARQELAALRTSGRAVLLDSQNCSMQSAVWRAMFQGHLGLVGDLLLEQEEGCGGSGARVEPLPRPSGGGHHHLPRQPAIKVGVPCLLAPFLSDSPVSSNLHVRLPRRRYSRGQHGAREQYSALAAQHTARTLVAPAVDRGWLQGPGVTERVATLVRQNTGYPVAGDATVVDPAAVVPLMFGEVTAGLRQLAVRALLRQVLFSRSPDETMALLDSVCRQSGFVTASLAVAPSSSRLRGAGGGEVLRQDYELELGDEVELSFSEVRSPAALPPLIPATVSPSGGDSARDQDSNIEEEMERRQLRVANFDDAVEEVEDITEILDSLDKLDRELEVVRTDCVLQALDRDLATWEEELEGTLGRITRYQEELRALQLPGCPLARRREACRAVGAEEARRRSEQLMEELRSQRSLLEGSEQDLTSAERVMEDRAEVGELVRGMDSLVLEGGLLQARLERSEEERLESARRRLDENWSLGSERGLEEEPRQDCSPLAQHSTDRLVRSLQVSVSVRAPPQPPVRGSSLPSPPLAPASSSSSSDEAWSQSWGREGTASPRTMASNLVTLNSRLFQQRRRIGAGAVGLVEPDSPLPALLMTSTSEEATSEEEETSLTSGSSSDSDTWGGTFSLRHTQSLRPPSCPPGDAAVLCRLTARTLTAITDSLGVPHMLRPCFALEAARLQLLLALAGHQAIACDRNCEGEESDSDSEEDWLASDTDSEDDTGDEAEEAGGAAPHARSDADAEDTSEEEEGGSELSEFSSRRSWMGSLQGVAALAPSLSPPASPAPSHSSSSAWLPDRDDLQRMRAFLATNPGSDFNRSTASESEGE